jgi:hypothetical protein
LLELLDKAPLAFPALANSMEDCRGPVEKNCAVSVGGRRNDCEHKSASIASHDRKRILLHRLMRDTTAQSARRYCTTRRGINRRIRHQSQPPLLNFPSTLLDHHEDS